MWARRPETAFLPAAAADAAPGAPPRRPPPPRCCGWWRKNTGTGRSQRPAGARQDQRSCIALESEIVQIALVQAGQGGYGQNAHVALGIGGCPQHAVVAVHRAKVHPAPGQLPHGRRHGCRNVEQLEVGEDLLALIAEFVSQRKIAAGEEQFQPQLVKDNRIAKPLDEPAGGLEIRTCRWSMPEGHLEAQFVEGVLVKYTVSSDPP